MKTVSLQIGNGDDKLSQAQWHDFVVKMKQLIERHCERLHFFGAPENWSGQQNVALIFDVEDAAVNELKAQASELRKQFRQESAAWTEGETVFI